MPRGGPALSAITVQSFADLGYGVDVTQADPYTLPLPGAASGKASAKIAAANALDSRRGSLRFRRCLLPVSRAALHWLGNIPGGPLLHRRA